MNRLRTIYNLAIEALLDFGERPCRLYMPTTKTQDCTACDGGTTSTGPNRFNPSRGTTTCAICGGDGKIEVEVTKTLNLVVIFDNKKFVDAGGNVNFADNVAQTVSIANETHTDIIKCKYIIFDTEIEYFENDRYERYGRPQTLGLGENKYLITNWKKVA